MADQEEGQPFIARTTQVNPNLEDDEEHEEGQAWCFYLSHFISVWGFCSYEAATFSFIQAASGDAALKHFQILTAIELLCALPFIIPLGQWISSSASRLNPLLAAIVINRASMVFGCILWPVLLLPSASDHRWVCWVVLAIFGTTAKLSQVANTICVEREWTPTLANHEGPRRSSGKSSFAQYMTRYPELAALNAATKAIEIVCGLLAPILTSYMVSAGGATLASLLIGIAVSPCIAIEAWCARKALPSAKAMKKPSTRDGLEHLPSSNSGARGGLISLLRKACCTLWSSNHNGIRNYLSSEVWVPSACLALTYSSLLDWSLGLVAILVSEGFETSQLSIARFPVYFFALSGASIFLVGVRHFTTNDGVLPHSRGEEYQMLQREVDSNEDEESVAGNAPDDATESSEKDTNFDAMPAQYQGDPSETACAVQTSRWAVVGYFAMLSLTIIALICTAQLHAKGASAAVPSTKSSRTVMLTSVLFFGFLAMSRLGLTAYHLSVLQLTQILVPWRRAEFGGVEQGLIGCIQLAREGASAIWSSNLGFRWLALGSLLILVVASGLHLWWCSRWKARYS